MLKHFADPSDQGSNLEFESMGIVHPRVLLVSLLCFGLGCNANPTTKDTDAGQMLDAGQVTDGTLDFDAALPAHCDDGELNGDETSIDCGGICAPCPGSEDCNDDSGCDSGHCADSMCQPTQCGDGYIGLGEACDSGNGEAETCPYGGEDCLICDTDCQQQTIIARRCGDSVLDPEEACDDGMGNGAVCTPGVLSCEICSRGCQLAAGETSSCGDASFQTALTERMEGWMTELTRNVGERPTSFQVPEATVGTLSLGLNPNAFVILGDATGVYAAGSHLGGGRVVAYSGQDFISSTVRSSLLDNGTLNPLLGNTVRWTSQSSEDVQPRILVDSQAIAHVLNTQGYDDVTVTPTLLQRGLWQTRDWTEAALENVDVAVVQVNEWGTLRVGPAEIEPLRDFVRGGGGLVIAGSALHWSWWLSDSAERFIGNLILVDTGISWRVNSITDLSTASTAFNRFSSVVLTWCAYLNGEDIPPAAKAGIDGAFVMAKALGRDEEVNTGLERLINDTPPLPISTANPDAQLTYRVSANLPPHTWANIHPWTETFPGPIAASPPSTMSTVIDPARTGSLALKTYAAPGSVVTVRVPDSLVGLGAKIRVGERYDNLASINTIDVWRRPPLLFRTYPVNSTELQVGHAFGGAVYLVLDTPLAEAIEVNTQGGLPMLVYTRHASTRADWDTIQTQLAPQVILEEKGHVRMVVDTEAAKAVTDPDAVIDFWTGFHQHHIDLASEPTPRLFESHWIFDTQVGWGYANATPARLTFPKLAQVQALRTETGNEDWWLFGHELGHQFQTSDWTGGDVTEVCVNLFTMYTLNHYLNNGGNFQTLGRFEPDAVNHAALRSMRWENAGLFEKLDLYRQLIQEFGWIILQETFASYYDDRYPRMTHGSFMDGFAIRMSVFSGRDLSEFLSHWNYPMSSSAAARIRGLNLSIWMPPGW